MDELKFNFQVDAGALKILVRAVEKYLEKWPGGDAREQEAIQAMLVELRKAKLDLDFLE